MTVREPTETAPTAGELRKLAEFAGEPREFWRRFLEATAVWCGADHAVALVGAGERWHAVARRPVAWQWAEELPLERLQAWAERIAGGVAAPWREMAVAGGDEDWCVAPMRSPEGGAAAFIVVKVAGEAAASALEKLAALLAAPELYEQRRLVETARRDAARLAQALDVVALLNAQSTYPAAAMALCNELASRFQCERASLGWVESNAIAVKAMSHTEKLEPKSEATQQLASAMEECLDQEEEIIFPRLEGQAYVARSHEVYAQAHGAAHLASLPLFPPAPKEGERARPLGAVTLERAGAAMTVDELRAWRLILDQATRPLVDLHARDKWFGARWAAYWRTKAAGWLGPEHTWWKLLALLLAAGLLVLIFGRKTHRVEGSFALKTDAMAVLSAPFEGHIAAAPVRPGDAVKEGDALVSLDARELLLQKEAALAERERHAADALKAESSGDVAGLRVARARQAQAQAQCDLVEDRLARASVKAPFDGVVVEGDLRERIAAPVQKGDGLLKIARIEDLYLVIEIPERDVQEIAEGAQGRAAFASQPGRSFEFTVEKIEPVARAKEQGSVFSVRCRFHDAPEDWWRPGMSGVAKIDCGTRSLLWITTHRTVDFLRMWWW